MKAHQASASEIVTYLIETADLNDIFENLPRAHRVSSQFDRLKYFVRTPESLIAPFFKDRHIFSVLKLFRDLYCE